MDPTLIRIISAIIAVALGVLMFMRRRKHHAE